LSELPFFFTVLKGVEMMCLCMSSVHFIWSKCKIKMLLLPKAISYVVFFLHYM
jgi:hypothetical protein